VPVLLLFVLLLMLCLILASGYRLRLPLFLGELSPAPGPAAASLAAEIQELKQLLGRRQSSTLTASSSVLSINQAGDGAGSPRRLGASVQELDLVDGGPREEPVVRRRRPLLADRHLCRSSSAPGSPARPRPPALALTPVKATVLERPGGPATPLDLRTGGQAVLDLRVREEGLDLRKEDVTSSEEEERLSEGSPRKELVVVGDPASPSTTSFGWVEAEAEGGRLGGGGRCPGPEADTEFLSRVEGLFQREEGD
jgi:hypothetical protein